MHPIIELVLITFIPTLELRASIPYGIVSGMSWQLVFLVCVIANILLGILVYLFFDKLMMLAVKTPAIKRIYSRWVEKIQNKIKKYVDRYGQIGMALFIGVPLPGSGVYTAAIGSYFLGLKFKNFIIADILGVVIAGIIVTLIVLGGNSLFSFF